MVDQAIDGKKYQYQRYKNLSGDAWGLKIWDKKELGSLKGKQVCLNTENPEPVAQVLSEDADEFTGAKARLTFIQKTEHTSWNDKTESFRVFDINSVEYKYGLYAGRLPGSEL